MKEVTKMHLSETKIKVRYSETDQMGVVYHANYLIWLELGRTTLVEDLGFNYAEMEKDGVVSPVVDVALSYKKPARYGDTVTIYTWVEDYDGLRTTYGYKIQNEAGDLCLTGKTVHICVRKDNFRPIKFRKVYPEWDAAYNQAKKQ